MGQRPLRRLALIPSTMLLIVTAVWCAYWLFHARGYWEDDAWIHLEFARSFAAGHGFTFNGLAVSGDTSPLWVMLLAAIHTLLPDWLAAGKLLTVLGALLGFAGIYAFAHHTAQELLGNTAAPVFAASIVLLTVANPYTCYWLFSGMETVAAAGLACWTVVLATRKHSPPSVFLISCALAGLAPLLRPEMLFLSALLALPLFQQWRRMKASSSRKSLCVAGGLLLLAPLLIWSIYSVCAFGHLLPSTVVAKRAAEGESVPIRILKLYASGLPLLLVLPTAATVERRLLRKLPSGASVFLLWTALTLAFYLLNHTYVQSRYVLLSAPGLLSILMAVLLAAWPRTGRTIYVIALAWSALLSLLIVRPFLSNKQASCRDYAQMALFIRDNVPMESPVAVYSIGEIAFLSQHPIVDIGGITRPGALPYLDAGPDAQLRWAKAEGAQFQVSGGDPPESGAEQVYSIAVPFTGWAFDPAVYRSQETLALWKLTPDASQNASASMAPHP